MFINLNHLKPLRWLTSLGAVLAVVAFLSFNFLFAANLGGEGWNEVDVLPLARQFADPSWLPNDWYLNQPAGYRLLFLAIAGHLVNAVGFLWTSILGRFVCYVLVGVGLVWIAQQLQLRLPFLLLAVGVFVFPYHIDGGQGAIAEEWLVGGLEPKAVAYGFVLMAIACLLARRYRWMAVLLGIATSFHVLVGGWSALASFGWILLKPKERFPAIAFALQAFGLYALTSVFAIPAVFKQLFSPDVDSQIPSSYVYVFWRLPHHLNPLGWEGQTWIRVVIYLILLSLCIISLKRSLQSAPSKAFTAQLELAEWTLITLIPFGLGLAIAPFDTTGAFLQYYPFRLADVMLPLNTYLLFACQLQQLRPEVFPGIRQGMAWALVGVLCVTQWNTFKEDFLELARFPAATVDEGAAWVNLCEWIRNNTPRDAVFLAPPEEHSEFTWIAERAKVVDYKLFPQTPQYIDEWQDRLNDVTGGDLTWPKMGDRTTSRNELRLNILESYDRLSTREVENIAEKYQVDYVLVRADSQALDLPIVRDNEDYVLYGKP